MKQHRTFREMLARRAELDPADKARLRHHLERCEECSLLAETYEMQDALLASLVPRERRAREQARSEEIGEGRGARLHQGGARRSPRARQGVTDSHRVEGRA